MDPTTAAIELTIASWEQWIGAMLRAQRLRALTATARPRRRRPSPAKTHRHVRASLVWMLAVSVAGFLLLG